MASSLLKIAEVCFPEFKDTELLYSITKSFEKGKLTNPPYSLMDATIECLMKDALEDEEVLQQIGNILRNYPLQLSSLYLLQGNPEMLKIAFDWSFSRDNGPLSIDIQNYTCILTVKKHIIAEFAITQGFDYPKAIVLSAVQKGCVKLRVSVTAMSRIVNACIPGIKTSFVLWSITHTISTKKSDKTSPDSLMRIASSVALIKALENSEISDLVEEILKTDILEVCSFHYLEKHPKLLSTALYFSLQKDSGHVGIEIFNQSCKLTVGNEIVATVLIHDFQWPIYFTTLLIVKRFRNFIFYYGCYSGIETKYQM
ncbi:hypothetical protein CRE_04416 [Caenorhabditis remanei]|uniref:Uncharacterized protein n=1 Tax=Caenorhabditis remanei TaxID=31234 RepID=E3NN07_CAERE|nr:hypothetical protein CRE_04416 [Caenorhabditis remanei]